MNSPVDKFPVFVDDAHNAPTESSTAHPNLPGRPGLHDIWPPPKAGHVAWEYLNGPGSPKHRPRKSMSEALSTIRTRNASMSANAQELAAALGAPVSYRLIVGPPLGPSV
jgi:solute carrier family 35, member E1